jgi:hypothetical protein
MLASRQPNARIVNLRHEMRLELTANLDQQIKTTRELLPAPILYRMGMMLIWKHVAWRAPAQLQKQIQWTYLRVINQNMVVCIMLNDTVVELPHSDVLWCLCSDIAQSINLVCPRFLLTHGGKDARRLSSP